MAFEVSAPLSEEATRRAAEAALAHGGRSEGQLDVIFVSDEALAKLHGRFLGDDSLTDVMAFDLSDGEPHEFEVYVSVDRALEVAKARAVSVERELALYVVHGTLHLCGFDDHEDEDRERMRAAEASVMTTLGYPSDDTRHEYVGE